MSDKNCIDIIREYLIKNKFDGLYDPYSECGCESEDLSPCCNSFEECRPGYKHMQNEDWFIKPFRAETGCPEANGSGQDKIIFFVAWLILLIVCFYRTFMDVFEIIKVKKNTLKNEEI